MSAAKSAAQKKVGGTRPDFSAMGSRRDPAKRQSRVTTGKSLFLFGNGNSTPARRFTDIYRAILVDLGGADAATEAQKQLARRAAALSVACERLEGIVYTGTASPADVFFQNSTGGLSAYDILTECAKVLHGIARARGGADATVFSMAKLPDAELTHITTLLKDAGDLAQKAISVGSESHAALGLLGILSDRCGRAFCRLGLERRARDVTSERFGEIAARAQEAETVRRAAELAGDVLDAEVIAPDQTNNSEAASEPVDVVEAVPATGIAPSAGTPVYERGAAGARSSKNGAAT